MPQPPPNEKENLQVQQPSALFELIWQTLVPVIGTAATSTLLRRSARRASARGARIDHLVIEQRGLEHVYSLPEAWGEAGDVGSMDALRAVTSQLRPLLAELTGPVLLKRLNANPDLRRSKLFADEEGT